VIRKAWDVDRWFGGKVSEQLKEFANLPAEFLRLASNERRGTAFAT
jgi:hypothetical protein